MKKLPQILATLLVLSWAGFANAGLITFNFQFDDKFDGVPLDGNIVGTGSVSFDDLGNGTFGLLSLVNLDMTFSVNGDVFTLADASTPLDQVLVIVSNYGSFRRLQFSNLFPFGDGLFGGSFDLLTQIGGELSFEPPGNGAGELNLYIAYDANESGYQGSYLALSNTQAVPAPAALVLLVLGVAGIAGLRKRK